MFKWILTWWYSKMDKKYNNQFIIVPTADFKYPPPSAYEVKQIIDEYGVTSVSMEKLKE